MASLKPCSFTMAATRLRPRPDARRIADLVRPVETPQHSLALLFADARAGIRDAHDGFVVAAFQFDAHPAAFRRELDGVVDEVGDRLEQQIPVAEHVKAAVSPRLANRSFLFSAIGS